MEEVVVFLYAVFFNKYNILLYCGEVEAREFCRHSEREKIRRQLMDLNKKVNRKGQERERERGERALMGDH